MSPRIALINLECTFKNQPPLEMEKHEIIEICAVICEISASELNIIGSLQLYVKPLVNPILTEPCTRVTGIQQSFIDGSRLLADVLPDLEAWISDYKVNIWGAWGVLAKSQFIIECRVKELKNPLAGTPHFDLRQLFAQKFGHQVDVPQALSIRGSIFEGSPSSGVDRVKNIARLLAQEEVLLASILKRIKPI